MKQQILWSVFILVLLGSFLFQANENDKEKIEEANALPKRIKIIGEVRGIWRDSDYIIKDIKTGNCFILYTSGHQAAAIPTVCEI